MGLLDDAIREHLELKRRRGADAGAISKEESEALGPVPRGPDGAPDLSDTFVPGEPVAETPAPAPDWEAEQTAVLDTMPAAPEPPPADAGYEPPPAPPAPAAGPPSSGYAAPPVPPYQPPASAPAYQPPPPPPAYEPASPPPPAASEPERPWYERAPDEPEPTLTSQPEPAPAPEPEHQSRLARFRPGRRSKQAPPPPPPPAAFDEPPSSYEPPPLPSSYEPASPFEPPPHAPSGGFDPATAHEPDIVPADEEPDVEDVLEETPDFLEETPEHDRLWFEQRPPRDFDFDD